LIPLRPFGLFVLSASLAGCGQILGLADPVDATDASPPLDAGVDAPAPLDASDGGLDALPDASACNTNAPFGNPTPIPGADLNAGADQGTPRLSPDEETLYFWSDRGSDGGATSDSHLYSATRASKAAAFDPSTLLSALSSAHTDASPTVSADGLTMLFESDRLGGGNAQLFIATRAAGAAFANPSLLANVNVSSANEATPYLRPDGQVLYFSSSRGGVSQDIYRTTLQGDGSFSGATPVIELNSSADEYSPTITADELDVYWASQRTDLGSEGDFDIFHAHRATTADAFGPLESAGTGVNSSALDLPGWISPDGCSLYFESERDGPRQIYVARRTQ
jgi:Tol biopolymer transport system component